MYTDLQWSELRQKHEPRWDVLKSKYSLAPIQELSSLSLDAIAKKCVDSCYHVLFDTDEVPNLQSYTRETPESGQEVSAIYFRITDLADRLRPFLCDHLIVTFAHRFYCDNLEPCDLRKCLRIVAKSYVKKTEDTERDESRRADFCDSKRTTFMDFQKGVEASISYCEDLLTEKSAKPEDRSPMYSKDMLSAPNWLFSLCMASGWKNSPYAVKKRENAAESPKFAFLRQWDEKKLIHDGNLLEDLTQFIAKNNLCRFLFKWQDKTAKLSSSPFMPVVDTTQSILELRTVVNNPRIRFAAIACPALLPICMYNGLCDFMVPMQTRKSNYNTRCTSQGKCKCERDKKDKEYKKYKLDNVMYVLESQSYTLRNSSKEVEIPQEIQYVFNNYLFEKWFHGYAMTVTLYRIELCIQQGLALGQLNQMQNMIRIVRLSAPMLHPPLIHFLSEKVPRLRAVNWAKWVDTFIDYWNSVALPVLEELFVWSIVTSYNSLGAIFDAIRESFVQDKGRCNRLNFFRLSPAERSPDIGKGRIVRYDAIEYNRTPTVKNEKYHRDAVNLFNNIVFLGYAYGMNFIPDQGFHFTKCTAFDTTSSAKSEGSVG